MITPDERAGFVRGLQARRRGRPRRTVPTVRATVALPADVYDALCRRALQERKSLHALFRETLEQRAAS